MVMDGVFFLCKFVLSNVAAVALIFLLRELAPSILARQLAMYNIEFDVVYIKCKPTATTRQ